MFFIESKIIAPPSRLAGVAAARERLIGNYGSGAPLAHCARLRELRVWIWMAAILFFAWAPTATAVQAWRIDEAHTSIGFKINAVGFPTTRGYFNRYSGRMLIDLDHPAKSYASFTVEAASVDLGSKSFDDFVKSPALLNVQKYPILAFTSTQVEKRDARTALVAGNLTMIGVTKPITLTVDVGTTPSPKGRALAFLATGTITRSDFGMIFGVPIIDNTIEITVKTRALTDE